MPHDAPTSNVQQLKLMALKDFPYDRYESRRRSSCYPRRESTTLIPPFDHLEVIAGQSTCVQEFFNQSGSMDQLVISVGGDLISGGALAARDRSWCRLLVVNQ